MIFFWTKDEASDIVGIAPDNFNTLQEIAESINNDNNFFQTIDNKINLKRNIADSYSKIDINSTLINYYTKVVMDNKIDNKCYTKIQTDDF